MSEKELRRAGTLARVAAKELQLIDAATILRISYRQAKRLWKQYRAGGAAALKHGNAGRPSNRKRPEKERKKILELVRSKYEGFGPTLAAEHLASEDKSPVQAETLRRWMLAEGLWKPVRKHKQHRSRRCRREHFGELVQLDGSFHDWYQGRGPTACLMNMVDDATSTVEGHFADQETTWAAATVLKQWIGKYGVPVALYTDWRHVYLREPTEKEALRGVVPLTQFGRMCQKLDIRIIAASSPQAKGRVERGNGTHQDRLVKKMGLKKIPDHQSANGFLQQKYLADHNERFARPPAKPENYHRKAPPRKQLEGVFCLETERTISNDWVVRYANRYFQLEKQSRYAPAQSKVTVCEWENGSIEIRYRAQPQAWLEISRLEAKPGELPKPAARPVRTRKPPNQHPWRTAFNPRLAAAAAKRNATDSATP